MSNTPKFVKIISKLPNLLRPTKIVKPRLERKQT